MTARHGTGLRRPVNACTLEQKSRWFLPLKGEAFRHKLNRSVEVSFGSRKEAFTWLS